MVMVRKMGWQREEEDGDGRRDGARWAATDVT
jgi:hypothetical protein